MVRKTKDGTVISSTTRVCPIEPEKPGASSSQFFFFPKQIIESGILTAAELSIYTVLCSFADFEKDKWFHIPVLKIAKFSGMNEDVARAALNHISNRGLFIGNSRIVQRKKATSGKQHYYMYKVWFIRKKEIKSYKGEYFTFNANIVKGGTWAELKPTARGAYIAMRATAEFDREMYMDIEGHEYNDKGNAQSNGDFKRAWQVCRVPYAQLCRMAHINVNSAQSMVQNLIKHGLIKIIERHVFQVNTYV